MMSKYIGLENFAAVYVVDLCHSLCEVAKKKAQQKGWKNVHVIEGDACRFQPPGGQATLVTFSYSLSSGSCRHALCQPSPPCMDSRLARLTPPPLPSPPCAQ